MCSEERTYKKVLICATGSVATIKIPQILTRLKQELQKNVEIRFVPTAKALHFLPSLEGLVNWDGYNKELDVEIFRDEDEWLSWKERGDPVLHIELRKWADLLIIGNIISKVYQLSERNFRVCKTNPYLIL